MQEQLQVPYSSGRAPSSFQMPAGACDTHFHIFDPIRFPYKDSDTRNQPPATVDCYRLFKRRTGVERSVIVTPSCYGFDNSCTLSALRELGASARAVVVIDESVPMDTLRRWDEWGVRGIRFNVVGGTEETISNALRLSERVSTLGWHTDFYLSADLLVHLEATLNDYPTPVVIDHMGSLSKDTGLRHAAYDLMLALMRQGKGYVKVSGFYLNSHEPDYADTLAAAKALIDEVPERILWGSDWPHHACWYRRLPMPDDARLVDAVFHGVAPEHCRQILTENPAVLYGFAHASPRRTGSDHF